MAARYRQAESRAGGQIVRLNPSFILALNHGAIDGKATICIAIGRTCTWPPAGVGAGLGLIVLLPITAIGVNGITGRLAAAGTWWLWSACTIRHQLADDQSENCGRAGDHEIP